MIPPRAPIGCVLIVCLLRIAWPAPAALAAQAAAGGKSPDDDLKKKGLTRVGVVYVLDGDAKLPEGLRAVRAGKVKMDDYAAKRAAIEKRIDAAKAQIQLLEEEYRLLNDQLVRAKGANAVENNRIVGQISKVTSEMRDGERFLLERARELSSLADPRNDYIAAVMDLSKKMEQAAVRYTELAADEEVKGALARLNAKPGPKFRLGPSPQFTQEVPWMRKQRESIDTGVVKMDVRSGLGRVSVTINGTATRAMVLDSGASVVTLPWAVANEAGALPGIKDPVIPLTIADGSRVQARLVRLESVQMGPYVVKDVEAAVLPKGVKMDECLLGGSFLRHFVYRVDLGGGELHVTRVKGKDDPTAAAESGKATGPATAPSAPATAPAAVATALKDLTKKLNDFGQWRDERGKWSVTGDGRLRGEGDSEVQCPIELPEEVIVSWRMRIIKGLRARVFFDGTGTYFGTEGFDHTLTMYRGQDMTVERVKFEHGRDYAVSLRFDKEWFECKMDGKRIAVGKRTKSGPIKLRLAGGDSWSAGTTEFWGFELSPVDPKASQASATAKAPTTSASGGGGGDKEGGKEFTVLAEGGWQTPVDTGIRLRAGEKFVIEPNPADRWEGGGSKRGVTCDYRGYPGREGWMALHWKVGSVNQPVEAGKVVAAPEAGTLLLFCNDAKPKGNTGWVRAVVKLPDAPAGDVMVEGGWTILFRSADPAHWDSTVETADACAVALDRAPQEMKYLRAKNLSAEGDFVIIPLTAAELRQKVVRQKYGWEGRNYEKTAARHLGVIDKSMPRHHTGSIDVTQHPGAGYTGYGFGNRVNRDDRQGYVWAGKPVDKAVIEIAVKAGELTEEEKAKLLSE